MTSMFGPCLSLMTKCLYGEIDELGGQVMKIAGGKKIPEVILDTTSMGSEAVVVKSGIRLCGTGAACAIAPIVQDKAYWEVKIQMEGVWSAGLCTSEADLNKDLGLERTSWAVTSKGEVRSSNFHIYDLKDTTFEEGDILGFTYDHVELNVYLNGKNLLKPIFGIRGTVFPVIYVDEGAILDCIFEDFKHEVPDGFKRIMIEQPVM